MEKNELIAWESKCVQEEAPECTSTCPLHVDARHFLKEIRKGDWGAAYKVLNKTMPFPGILGRICDHPCEERCKRNLLGGPIAIGALERLCVEKNAGRKRIQPLPRKSQCIAVLGGGLSGVTSAFDLLRKGFVVSLYDAADRLGGALLDMPQQLLPREVITEELAVLEALRADIQLGVQLDKALFDRVCEEYDAVVIDRDSAHGIDFSLELDEDGLIAITPSTGATNMEKVFAGGGTRLRGCFSPVMEVLEGRKPALSIERLMQKVNLEVGRGHEGSYNSRLYTNLEDVDPVPRVVPADTANGYTEEEAFAEASRCIQCECMECVKKCLFMERYKGYPKKYAREIFNNERILLGAAHQYNVFTNSCSACGLCETVCPNGFSMADMCLEARRTLLKQKIMPPSFHEFALQDMAYSNGERFFLLRHEPGKQLSEWLYFPSCQLSSSSPGEVMESYTHLKETLSGGVGILLGCCGAPAFWAGREDLFREAVAMIRDSWIEMGKPRVITACATCQDIFTENIPEIDTVPIWKLLEQYGVPVLSGAGASGAKKTVAIVDPCITRKNREVQKSIRAIVQKLGMVVEELPLSGDKPECCGYGGLMYNANPTLARDVVERRSTASESDYLAYCAMCRDNFAFAGKKVSHLIEHLFPVVEGADPADRGWISWSERRSNRAKVREGIVRSLGEKNDLPEDDFEKLPVSMSDDVMKKIDRQRILLSDISKVIRHAEQTGRKITRKENGNFLAYLQPENVTFWVEYAIDDTGYIVHNAYCHRMKIVGVKR